MRLPEVDTPAVPNEPPGHAKPAADAANGRPYWTQDRIGSFSTMWLSGTSANAIRAAFNLPDLERVEQLRKQFGLKDRSVFTGASAQ